MKKIHEEEWSFIPVGGPLPVAQQPITAFGAAANLVHPATGYSIARSLREAPAFAEEVASLLRKQQAVGDTAESVWDALWPQEKRRQVGPACLVVGVAPQASSVFTLLHLSNLPSLFGSALHLLTCE